MSMKHKTAAAAACLGLSMIAAAAFANGAPANAPAAPSGAAPGRTLSFNSVACTITVNGEASPPDIIMPYPVSVLVRSVDATAADGTERHFSVGLSLDQRLFKVNIFDNDASVPDPTGSFNVHTTLAHDTVNAQLPVNNFRLQTPAGGNDPVIGVNCLSR